MSADAWKRNAALVYEDPPMCACGHTKASHNDDGCFACGGPPCDMEPREAVARVLYAAFARQETGRDWDDLRGDVLRDHFYKQADRVLLAVATYGSPDYLANLCDDAQWES